MHVYLPNNTTKLSTKHNIYLSPKSNQYILMLFFLCIFQSNAILFTTLCCKNLCYFISHLFFFLFISFLTFLKYSTTLFDLYTIYTKEKTYMNKLYDIYRQISYEPKTNVFLILFFFLSILLL